jgi:hypothetical protein
MRRQISLFGALVAMLITFTVPLAAQSLHDRVIGEVRNSNAVVLTGAAGEIAPRPENPGVAIEHTLYYADDTEGTWFIQTDRTLSSPMAAKGDTLTIFIRVFHQNEANLLRATAVVDDRIGIRAARNADRCEVTYA